MLIYGFANTISEVVAANLNSSAWDTIILDDKISVEKLLTIVEANHYKTVLGLGEYGGRDSDKIRIETVCKNRFRNNDIILRGQDTIAITAFIKPNTNMKLAQGMGNSWCNKTSYLIRHSFPDIAFSFLHIPKNFDIELAQSLIQKQI